MAKLSDFKVSQIVSTRTVGARITKNRLIIWFSKEYYLESNDSIWERMKTSSLQQNSGKKRKLSDRDCRTLRPIV